MAPWSRAVVPETASTSTAAAAPPPQSRRSHTPSSATQPQLQSQHQAVRSLAASALLNSSNNALRHSTSNASLSATYTSKDATEVAVSLSDTEDMDKTPTAIHTNIGDNTPRPRHQKVLGHKSSTDTLRAEAGASSSSSKAYHSTYITIPEGVSNSGGGGGSGPFEDSSRTRRQDHASSSSSPPQRRRSNRQSQPAPSRSGSSSKKFSLRSKKKRLEREDQEREERRLKEEADEAIRRKHGEYHAPGQSQGTIHTHRLPRHQDQHEVERQRSFSSMRQQYQYQQRHNNGSRTRVVSPTPEKSQQSIEDLRYYYQQQHQRDRDRDRDRARDRSRQSSRSTSSSSYSSRQGSRGTSPEASAAVRYGHNHHHRAVGTTVANGLSLNDLDPEGILSEYWETQSEQDDPDLDTFGPLRRDRSREGNSIDQERKLSMDTDSSFQSNPSSMSNGSSSRQSKQSQNAVDSRSYRSHGGVGLGNNLLYPSHYALQQQQLQEQLKTPIQQPMPTHQSRTDSRLSTHRALRALEMGEVKPHHQSWPLNNASQTGIVTGLDPALEVLAPVGVSHPQHQQNRLHGSISGTYRPGSSQSQSRYLSAQQSRDNMVERYLYHARANSPSNSNGPPSSNHRSSSSNNQHPHLYHLDHHPRSTSAFGHHTSIDMAAVESLRAKAGSRVSRLNESSTIHTSSGTNTAVATSPNIGMFSKEIDETMELPDEHNYLAPLPPFQRGPAYTRLPKRRFCQWCFGGCRWWVLLLLIFILLVAAAIVFVSLKHYWPPWL